MFKIYFQIIRNSTLQTCSWSPLLPYFWFLLNSKQLNLERNLLRDNEHSTETDECASALFRSVAYHDSNTKWNFLQMKVNDRGEWKTWNSALHFLQDLKFFYYNLFSIFNPELNECNLFLRVCVCGKNRRIEWWKKFL